MKTKDREKAKNTHTHKNKIEGKNKPIDCLIFRTRNVKHRQNENCCAIFVQKFGQADKTDEKNNNHLLGKMKQKLQNELNKRPTQRGKKIIRLEVKTRK